MIVFEIYLFLSRWVKLLSFENDVPHMDNRIKRKEEEVKARIEPELNDLIDAASLALLKTKSEIVRLALEDFLKKYFNEIKKGLKEKIELLKSFEKSEVSEGKIVTTMALYKVPKETAIAFAKADMFVEKLGIKGKNYSLEESWWIIAAKYYQGEIEHVEKIEKALGREELNSKDLGYSLFYSKRKYGLIPENENW